MKRFITAIALAVLCSAAASAQPRAIGGRVGATGLEASYEHTLGSNFIETDLGMDFGFAGLGFKATGIYNFVFARPAWTDRGTWGLYAGPGISLGYVADMYRINWVNENLPGNPGNVRKFKYSDYGFMFSFTGQVGLEYTFWFPLQLSVDIRPYIGLHVTDHNGMSNSRAEFYDYGLFGFIPTVSARFRF